MAGFGFFGRVDPTLGSDGARTVPSKLAQGLHGHVEEQCLSEERLDDQAVAFEELVRLIGDDFRELVRVQAAGNPFDRELLVDLELDFLFDRRRTPGTLDDRLGLERTRYKQDIPSADGFQIAFQRHDEIEVGFVRKFRADIDRDLSSRVLQHVVEVEQVLPSHDGRVSLPPGCRVRGCRVVGLGAGVPAAGRRVQDSFE